MLEKYVNPFTDFGFKKIFGEEANKDILIDFLNNLLDGKEVIKTLTFNNTEHLGNTAIDRKAVFDLYCENEQGEKFIIELQKSKQQFFKERALYYATFPIQEQAELGYWDFRLKAVYLVGILDFVFDEDKDKDEYRHNIKLKNDHNEVFYDKLSFIYLEMPKFNKSEAELETTFDKWMYVLKSLPYLQDRPKILREKIFKKLFNVAELAKFTPAEHKSYEHSLKYYRDLNNVLDTARNEAKEEGYNKGYDKGYGKGYNKGKEEAKNKVLSIAKTMKTKDISMQEIIECTGLTEQEINEICV